MYKLLSDALVRRQRTNQGKQGKGRARESRKHSLHKSFSLFSRLLTEVCIQLQGMSRQQLIESVSPKPLHHEQQNAVPPYPPDLNLVGRYSVGHAIAILVNKTQLKPLSER